ncbi:DUF7668 domain-containing protein [Sinorhizobium mexicanum]|uniref:DUF7668 domain-containing protein n=1 Tax=Sinorhizobium mexicanum TaxID=375549 RepID=A0A859QGT9_9HYPH|nr:hypothetical protein [Sinorhizobium mexicanum]MBP1881931.1 hypothetical protein [Sinorhizobium mexicanum]QLL61665.1 hypothetical protein FKV68_09510 [Sinorhizobium mexicanum]
MSTSDRRVVALLRQVVAWLVARDFVAVEARSRGVQLSAELMRQAVEEYGRTLVMPPDEAFLDIDAIAAANSDGRIWSIRFDLWTQEEGRSDLSLECNVVIDNGTLDIEVDNIHAL